jgi:hypothetical protein
MRNIKHLRFSPYIELLEDGCRLATSAFCNTRGTYVVWADPSKVISAAKCRQGVKREPVGDKLQSYRFQKSFSQALVHPMVMPTCRSFIGYDSKKEAPSPLEITLYDAPLVKELLKRGAHKVPFLVIASLNDAREFASAVNANGEVALVDGLNLDDPESFFQSESYTTFMTIDELEERISGHVSALDWSSVTKSSCEDDDSYKAFTSTQNPLDVLIVMGAPGVNVDCYWDAVSIRDSMLNEIAKRKNLLEAEDVEPLELLDRFARMYERHVEYADKHPLVKVIDLDGEDRSLALLKFLASKISRSPEALALANSELSIKAQDCLRLHLPQGAEFKPDVDSAPMLRL